MLLALAAAIISLGQMMTWGEIDTTALKGRPARLAWSEDGTQLYLQVVDGVMVDHLTFRHYLIAKGQAPKEIKDQPNWLQPYWKWKSAKSFYGDPNFTISVDSYKQLLDSPNDTTTTHGAFLQETVTGEQLLRAKQSGGTQITNRLLLKGQIIGEFVDEQIVPGYTFSWSPEEMRMIAYRSVNGRLAIMNWEGENENVNGTKDIILPAWSDDGNQIAFLERTGRKTFAVVVVPVL